MRFSYENGKKNRAQASSLMRLFLNVDDVLTLGDCRFQTSVDGEIIGFS